MKPQTKRSLCLGVFLVIVTLVVLYSYCNGSSVCYTFPLFNGLERDRLQAKPQAEMVVTSVIVQTKQPFNMGRIHKNQGRGVNLPSCRVVEREVKKNREKGTVHMASCAKISKATLRAVFVLLVSRSLARFSIVCRPL